MSKNNKDIWKIIETNKEKLKSCRIKEKRKKWRTIKN